MWSVTPAEARRLGVARALVGALFLIRTTVFEYVPWFSERHGGALFGHLGDGSLRISAFSIVFPMTLVKVLIAVRFAAAVFFTLGIYARRAGIVAVVSAALVWTQEPLTFVFTYYALLIAMLLLAAGDGARTFCLKPRRRWDPNEIGVAPTSSVWLVRGFVLSVYFWGGIAKLDARWLSGDTLRALHAGRVLEGPLVAALAASPRLASGAAIVTALVELALVPLLVIDKTRAVAVVLACGLHVVFELTARPDVFGVLMVVLLSLFWPSRQRVR